MTAKKSVRKSAKSAQEDTGASLQISSEQAKDVNYREDVAPQESETEFLLDNPSQEEAPNGDVIKDGVVQSTEESRREAEDAKGDGE